MDFCPIFSAPYIVGIGGYCSLIGEMTGRVGCTSHTDHPESHSGRLPDNSYSFSTVRDWQHRTGNSEKLLKDLSKKLDEMIDLQKRFNGDNAKPERVATLKTLKHVKRVFTDLSNLVGVNVDGKTDE